MAHITEVIKKNPLQTITVAIAIVGVVFSIFNFYLLANISPLERRVVALEKFDESNAPLITRFIQLEVRDQALVDDVADIKLDIRDIKNYLNIK